MLRAVADRLEQAFDRFKVLPTPSEDTSHFPLMSLQLFSRTPVGRIVTAPGEHVAGSRNLAGGGVAVVVPFQRLMAPSIVIFDEGIKRLLQVKAQGNFISFFVLSELFKESRAKPMFKGHFPIGVRPLQALGLCFVKFGAGLQLLPDMLCAFKVKEVARFQVPNMEPQGQHRCWRQHHDHRPHQNQETSHV